MKHKALTLFLVLCIAIPPWTASKAEWTVSKTELTAGFHYVKPGASGGCTRWADACELQTALGSAVAGDEIWVAEGIYLGTFQLRSGVAIYGGFAATETLRSQRDWVAHPTTLSGANSFRVISGSGVTETAVLDGFTISGGDAGSGYGGGMHVGSGSPTLAHLTVRDNHGWYAGGMYIGSGSPTMEDVTFSGNSASFGGGLYNQSGSPTLQDVKFISNQVCLGDCFGGGMMTSGGKPTLANVEFINNKGGGCGGMAVGGGSPRLTDVTFDGNDDGAMCISYGSPALINTTFTNNTAYNASGLYIWAGSAVLTETRFISNTAQNGGGMYIGTGSAVLTGTQFISNTAQNGGGMYIGTGSAVLTGTQFISNTAQNGGGMYIAGGDAVLINTTFITNQATLDGGGIFNNNSSRELLNVTLYGNTAAQNGGGMVNANGASPTLVNTLFSGNEAQNHGGAMFNQNGSPVLTNTTFYSNSAVALGGGIYNDTGSYSPMGNSIVWGNSDSSGSGAAAQVKNVNPSNPDNTIVHSLVQGGCPAGATCLTPVINADPLFLDADGPDGIPGTPDDDLRLTYISPAIDQGDNDALPRDRFDLDRDGDTTERLPLDLAGEPRITGFDRVDLGAYELAGCFWLNMYAGDTYLAAGQAYRDGFHTEELTATVKIVNLLAHYDDIGRTHFYSATLAYEAALACAATVSETELALTGLLNAHWESATGAILVGNEYMVQALDVVYDNPANPLQEEIGQLRDAIERYTQATDGYLGLLASEYLTGALALQPERCNPFDQQDTVCHRDLQRLALASAQKSRAYLELAERQFRQYTSASQAEAEATLRQGFDLGTAELTLLEHLWDGAVNEASYQALLRNISDMQRLFRHLQGGKNPFGYGPEYVPFHYLPEPPPWQPGNNNYEQTYSLAIGEKTNAQTQVANAVGKQQQVDDNWKTMQQRLDDIAVEYNAELEDLCGTNVAHEPDLADCHENDAGDIYGQLLRIKEANLRVQLVLQQMANQNDLIHIEQERAAKVAGIQRGTAIMYLETGEELAILASQEAKLRFSKSTAQGVTGILEGVFSGATSGSAFGPWGALVGGIFGGLFGAANWFNEVDVAEQLADVAAKQERLRAKQNAQVHYAEAAITDADSEALIKQYALRFAEYDIELSIAMNNLQQELARLKGKVTRVEYLLAEKAKAEAFTRALYQDPAGRVTRDYWMELAHDRFEVALDYAYRAGRALEYEINWDPNFDAGPLNEVDDLYGIRDIVTLDAALAQMNTAYNNWHSDNPSPQQTDDTVLLSQALGFEDAYDADLGRVVTGREKFNAFVRDRENWVDLDGNNQKESLQFTFQTSIFRDNRFFSTNVFNDRIVSVEMRVRGSNLGDGTAVILLKQSGSSFLRTQNAFKLGGPDDVREYNIEPLKARIVAATNDNPIPQTNQELATRSVAFTNWTLTLDKVNEPNNADVDIEGIEEIELKVTHEAYTLQTVAGHNLNRAAEPELDILQPSRTTSPARVTAIDLTGTYIGTVIITHPVHLPQLDLTMVLLDQNGNLSGYIHAAQVLGYPIVDQETEQGPALSGSWSGDGFQLQSAVYSGTGFTGTRQVVLHTGVISDGGEVLTGVYSETLWGLLPYPLAMAGTFTLRHSSRVPTVTHPVYLPLVLRN